MYIVNFKKIVVKNKKFKLPGMDFSEVFNNKPEIKEDDKQMKDKLKEEQKTEIIINDVLTYDSVKPIIEQLLNSENSISTIKCKNIEEIDITGLQFLISVKKHINNINIETNFTHEISELLAKVDCKF